MTGNQNHTQKSRSFRIILMLGCIVFILIPAISHAQEKVVAKNGDGIYSILRAHDRNPAIYFDSFIELNKKNLGKDNSLYIGRTYILPNKIDIPKILEKSEPKQIPQREFRSFEIFGPKYKNIEILDNQLKGAIYYLIAGHGGPDPGAIGKYGNQQLCEDEYAYDVVLRLGRKLITHGATVYIIIRDPNDGIRDDGFLKCDKDEVCYPNLPIPLNHNKRLAQRKNAVNKLFLKNKGQYQRLIIVHLDSRSVGQNTDVYFYHDKKSKQGEKLCQNLHLSMKKKYDHHQPGRGYHGTVSSRGLYMLRYTHPVTAFIELGNIQNSRDQQRFIKSSNRQALAEWLAEGLIKDFRK